jgi:hypothetical protein
MVLRREGAGPDGETRQGGGVTMPHILTVLFDILYWVLLLSIFGYTLVVLLFLLGHAVLAVRTCWRRLGR